MPSVAAPRRTAEPTGGVSSAKCAFASAGSPFAAYCTSKRKTGNPWARGKIRFEPGGGRPAQARRRPSRSVRHGARATSAGKECFALGANPAATPTAQQKGLLQSDRNRTATVVDGPCGAHGPVYHTRRSPGQSAVRMCNVPRAISSSAERSTAVLPVPTTPRIIARA